MEKKMTYSQALENAIAKFDEGSEVAERLIALKASIDKKNSSHSKVMTKTQKQNVGIKASLAEICKEKQMTATEITKCYNATADDEITIQRVSALLKQMVDENIVKREFVNKRAWFQAV